MPEMTDAEMLAECKRLNPTFVFHEHAPDNPKAYGCTVTSKGKAYELFTERTGNSALDETDRTITIYQALRFLRDA